MKKKKEPKKKSLVKIYSEPYYYARSIYFDVKIFPQKGIIHHVYTSSEIATRVTMEFNVRVPDSTIRRWSRSPDKDFEGRTWAEEWDKRVAEGIKDGFPAFNGAGGENRTLMRLPSPDFESGASACSTTPARSDRPIVYKISGDAIQIC